MRWTHEVKKKILAESIYRDFPVGAWTLIRRRWSKSVSEANFFQWFKSGNFEEG